MIPFTASILCSRSGCNPYNQVYIIESPGLRCGSCLKKSCNGVEVRVTEETSFNMNSGLGKKNYSLTQSENILLETVDCRSNRPLYSGPFLTMQRRRRRRKYVRTYLFKDPTLIDDISSYQTNFVLDRIDNWEFNAFILDNVTGGRPLPNLCVHLFKSYGLLEALNLDPVIVWKLFSIIEDGYHWRNPYHNAVHSADVTQAMHCFLQETMILSKLTPLEIFSALVAAASHDLDHPGVNQPFLIATSNHLAALYKNSSVLENHHWRSAMGCLNESGVSEILGAERIRDVEEQVKSLVLATDITRQNEFLEQLRNYLDTDTLDMNDKDVRHFVLQIALKCADICNPCRVWGISRKWSMKVCEEFFRQGDYERQLGLPVTPLCDRYATSVPKIQTGFCGYIVKPLFLEWHRMMNTKLSHEVMRILETNDRKWAQLLKDEQASKVQDSLPEKDKKRFAPNIILGDGDQITIGVETIAAKEAQKHDQLVMSGHSSRTVRFDTHTVITSAGGSDDETNGDQSYDKSKEKIVIHSPTEDENDNGESVISGAKSGIKLGLEIEDVGDSSEYLGIPQPYARRHSIATGLMGSNLQMPVQKFLASSTTNLNELGSSQESSGSSSGLRMVGRTVIRRESLPGRALPSKHILHLQKIAASATTLDDPEDIADQPEEEQHSSEDSIHFQPTFLPLSPSRLEKSSCSSCSTTEEILDVTYSLPEPSTSPQRVSTDLDELCPATSILSMSPKVAQVNLEQSAEMEDQRRTLIRQQTCPVVSIFSKDKSGMSRPRFLSAAAAVTPATVASSSILSQHKARNKSPEQVGECGERISGASSSEAVHCCEVICEEGEKENESSPPLEYLEKENIVGSAQSAEDNAGNKCKTKGDTEKITIESRVSFHGVNQHQDKVKEAAIPETGFRSNSQDLLYKSKVLLTKATQTDFIKGDFKAHNEDLMNADDQHECTFLLQNEQDSSENKKEPSCPNMPSCGSSDPPCSSSATSKRTIGMWAANRLWKSLNEDDREVVQAEEDIHPLTSRGKDERLCFRAQTSTMRNRLNVRRGSAPVTAIPSLGIRGSIERRSDPTQYHSNMDDCLETRSCDLIGNLQRRRGSAPLDLRQSVLLALSTGGQVENLQKSQDILPFMPSSADTVADYDVMTLLGYDEDPSQQNLKRRSSGGPEIFAAAKDKVSTSSNLATTSLLLEQLANATSPSIVAASSCGVWAGRRRGSLPIDVYRGSASCSSESESSAGDPIYT